MDSEHEDLGCAPPLQWARRVPQHRQLSGASTVVAFLREFVEKFPAARNPREQMLAIDWPIHRFHHEGCDPTRPVAVNLIEGRMNEVIAFLDHLTYGEGSAEGLAERHQAWRACMSYSLERWGGRRLEDEAE